MFWILLAVGVLGLFMTVLGLPGLWLFLAVALVAKLLGPAAGLGWSAWLLALALGITAEVVEFVASARYTRRYGGSRRAGWGALIGGLVGAVVGVPVPIVGSIIGSFVGSFAGALMAEYSVRRDHAAAGRAAQGAVIGRVVATTAKIGLGCVMIGVVLWSVGL